MALPIRPTFNPDVALEDLLADEQRRKAAEDWAMKRGGMAGDALDAMPFAWEKTGRFQNGQDLMHEAPAPTAADRFRSLGDAVGAIQQRLGPDGLNRYARGMDSAARVIAGIPGEGIDALPQAKNGSVKLSTDPTSDASKRAQDAFRAAYPDAPEPLIATVTEANFEELLKDRRAGAGDKTRRELAGATLTEQQARRKQDAYQFAKRFGLDLDKFDQAKQEFIEELAAKEKEAADKKAEKDAAVAVPGLEVVPGETPTPKDAEIIKGIRSANGELQRSVRDLRALHAKYGTEFGGKGGVPMRQTMTAIKLAAKTIADLGALSGPDQGLMEDLAGGDPTTIEASAKAFFGVDNTDEAMTQLERWAENRISAALEARGYRVKGSASASTAPKPKAPAMRKPAAAVLPTDASGTPTLDAPASTSKRYSKSKDTTYVFDVAGQVIRTEKGDTRGR